MFCRKCGAQIPDHSQACPYCHQPLASGQNQQLNYQQGGQQIYQQRYAQQQVRQRSRIDNIFSALVHDKTPGAIMEFTLWCGVCLLAVLFMMAAIMVKTDPTMNILGQSLDISELTELGGFRILYIFLMIFTIGMAVLMALRLKPIMLLYGTTLFQLIMSIFYYVTCAGVICDFVDSFDSEKYFDSSFPPFIIVLFVFILLVGLGLVTCLAIHLFSRINLGKIAAILSMVQAGLLLILSICMYTLPSVDVSKYSGEYVIQRKYMEKALTTLFSEGAFWLGSITFFLLCGIVAAYMALFFMGCIDSTKDKIYVAGSNIMRGNAGYSGNVSFGGNGGYSNVPAFQPGLKCIQGSYMGQILYLQGQEISIGTQPGVTILLQDAYVSHRHCSIRFNMATNYYEVMDMSTNGVYNQGTGARLQKGVYTSCPRGTVLCIGSQGQQFQLL